MHSVVMGDRGRLVIPAEMRARLGLEAGTPLLLSYDLSIEPVGVADAEQAARLWASHRSLSLGDRLCLALANRRRAVALTADAAWGTGERVRQIRNSSS